MSFNQHSSTCTQTHALKIPVLIFNLFKKTPKHKHLSIYSDDWHLKPTALTVQYKHSSTTSLVFSMKVPYWQTPTTFCKLVANSRIRAGSFAIKKNKTEPTRRYFSTVCIRKTVQMDHGHWKNTSKNFSQIICIVKPNEPQQWGTLVDDSYKTVFEILWSTGLHTILTTLLILFQIILFKKFTSFTLNILKVSLCTLFLK